MTIFNNYFKIVKKSLPIIITYTIVFTVFAIITVQSGGHNVEEFAEVKPVVAIINNDEDTEFLNNFKEYIKENAEIKEIENNENALKDALFFREVGYILIIPENFTQDFINGKSPKIETMQVPDSYNSNYCEMLLNKYLNMASVYAKSGVSQDEINEHIRKDLEKTAQVEMKQQSTSNSTKVKSFFNFSNYTVLAIAIFVISAVMFAFNNENIKKRNIVSKTSFRKINFQMFAGNIVLVAVIWLFYTGVSCILYPDEMFTVQGGLYILNLFVFCLPVLSLAFMIGSLVKNKQVQSAIANIVSLGSSFLCGSFVPQEMLSNSVLNTGKIFPSYWFIKNNEIISGLSKFDWESLQGIFVNMLVLCGYCVLFFVVNNVVGRVRLRK